MWKEERYVLSCLCAILLDFSKRRSGGSAGHCNRSLCVERGGWALYPATPHTRGDMVAVQVSFKVTTVTDIMRKYTGAGMPSQGGCNCEACCNACGMCCNICLCRPCTKPCFYHGEHSFWYADKPSDETVDTITKKTVGHDDFWSVRDELVLASLILNKDTAPLFKDPSSQAFRSKMIQHFGSRYTPEQCYSKVSNMQKGIKIADTCTKKTVMSLSITHWDPASQTVRTTVCVCDHDKVRTEEMMRFQIDASAAKSSMSEAGPLSAGSPAPVAYPSMFGGGAAAAMGAQLMNKMKLF